jgi:hypothetical protein
MAFGMLTGCAEHRVTTRTISTSWATVQAIAPGTEVGVLVGGDHIRYGRIREVTDHSLSLWERTGIETLPRGTVERLALRIATGPSRTPGTIKTAAASVAVAALLGVIIGGIGENHSTVDAGWSVFIIGGMAGTMIGAARAPQERFHERLVYIRP